MYALTTHNDRSSRPFDQRTSEKLLRLFAYHPILNRTMLTLGMQMDSPLYQRELQELLDVGTLHWFAPVYASGQRADRFCLATDVALLTRPEADFSGIIEIPRSREAIAYDPLWYMKDKIVTWMSMYPLLIKSYLSAAGNTTGENIRVELDELVRDGVLGRLSPESRKRADRYYLKELEEFVAPFFEPPER